MITKELVSYIKKQTALSMTRDEITKTLLRSGWQVADIEEAFLQVTDSAPKDSVAKSAQ